MCGWFWLTFSRSSGYLLFIILHAADPKTKQGGQAHHGPSAAWAPPGHFQGLSVFSNCFLPGLNPLIEIKSDKFKLKLRKTLTKWMHGQQKTCPQEVVTGSVINPSSLTHTLHSIWLVNTQAGFKLQIKSVVKVCRGYFTDSSTAEMMSM